ncbi:MAG: hypothetical protein WB626_03845 [Bacteroidota bacterium]
MRRESAAVRSVLVLLIGCLPWGHLSAQGSGAPLTMQGLDHGMSQTAAARAAGGTVFAWSEDPGMMFLNPAGLASLTGIRFSSGLRRQFSVLAQEQHYAPLKYYSNFSLLMEGLTGLVPDPDTSLPGVTAGDTVQRPFDDIGPHWSRSRHGNRPVQAALAVPFSLGSTQWAAGLGVTEYADMDHYYQNNNVLTPPILSERPLPTPRPPNDSLPVVADWSQFAQARAGSLRGYGAALAGRLTDELSAGVSGMIVRGSTDDEELRTGRGRLTFFTSFFRLDSVYRHSSRRGTSDYSGAEFTFSALYRGPHLMLGLAVTPPATITRKWSAVEETDTTGMPLRTVAQGEDRMRIPWRGRAGAALTPSERLTMAVEYELRSYESAVYTGMDGSETRPWLSASVVHAGIEFRALDWLTLRAGMRNQSEVFEPEGNALAGDPVSASVYSAGTGFAWEGFRLNLAYEYAVVRYEDVWGSAISRNTDKRHGIAADIVYEIPDLW